MMNSKKLFEFNKLGIIPGPDETEEVFRKRAEYCLNLKQAISTELKDKIPFSLKELQPLFLDEALKESEQYYDVHPNWVPIFFSNTQLTPWHGGCAWIFQVDEKTPYSAFLQMRQTFQQSKRYLGLYDRNEILAHEYAHIGRMKFEEPKFEELLAYRSSNSKLRKWIGPLIQSTWEGLLFVATLMMIFIVDFFLVLYGDLAAYQNLMYLKLIPLGLLLLGGIRLFIRHRQLNRCENTLKKITPNPLKINAILYRLTDKEIIEFGKMAKNEILDYIEEEGKHSPRWQVIKEGYIDESNHRTNLESDNTDL